MNIISNIKTCLIRNNWASAIELLECLEKHKPVGLVIWLKNGETIQLRDMCDEFKTWSIYSNRLDNLPNFNDFCALDSVLDTAKEMTK